MLSFLTCQSKAKRMNYTQLSLNERYQISARLQAGHNRAAIAKQLQRHRSTIDREIARCGQASLYDAQAAHALAMRCQQLSRNATAIATNILAHVDCYLRLALSPQQVCGRLLAEGIKAPSVESVYQHILLDQRHAGDLYTHLRCQKARRKRYASGRERRGRIAGRVCASSNAQPLWTKRPA